MNDFHTTPSPCVLVVGDAVFEAAVAPILQPLHLEAVPLSGSPETWPAHEERTPSAALVHLAPGSKHGFAALEHVRVTRPKLPVIAVAAQPTVSEAVRIMQLGAEGYVPLQSPSEIVEALRAALARSPVVAEPERARRLGRLAERHGLVGDSSAMKHVLRQVALVAPTKTTVLLLGETGTGKERLANAIHQASPRRHAPFVAVNCAALAETLLESELFGHEKGAFTGAMAKREGRFKAADGGTIFLDEIGDISMSTQVKLLRVLQERQIERVGGNETIPVDVRIIAATNRDLRQMVADRTFRADLFYRLNVMAIQVPPLRARSEDVPLLVNHILPRLAADLGLPRPELTPDAMAQLAAYAWPGNVRELENILERILVLFQGRTVHGSDLPPELFTGGPPANNDERPADPAAAAANGPCIPGAKFWEIERHAILATFEASGRNPLRTAEILGISLRTIHYRLREYRGESGRRKRRGIPASAPAWSPEPLQLVHAVARPAEPTIVKS